MTVCTHATPAHLGVGYPTGKRLPRVWVANSHNLTSSGSTRATAVNQELLECSEVVY